MKFSSIKIKIHYYWYIARQERALGGHVHGVTEYTLSKHEKVDDSPRRQQPYL